MPMRLTIRRPAVMQVIWLTSVRGVISTTSMPTTRPFFARPWISFRARAKGPPAGSRPPPARRDRRIHPVEVDGEVIATAIGDARQHGLHAVVVNVIGGD